MVETQAELIEMEVAPSEKPDAEDADFTVKTKGACFACFKFLEEGAGESGGVTSPAAIQEIYKYLKINWRLIWNDNSSSKILIPEVPLEDDNIGELKVALCLDCNLKIDKFKKLLEELEDIKRKVDSSLQLVVDKMEEVEKDDNIDDTSLKDAFWKRIGEGHGSPSNGNGVGQVELVRKLRERLILKVSSAKGDDGLFRSSKLKKFPPLSPKKSSVANSNPPKSSSEVVIKTCRICARKFKSEFSLRRHIFVHLTGDFPYKCSHCPNQFKIKAMLEAHVKRQHANQDAQETQSKGVRTSVIVTQMKSGAAAKTSDALKEARDNPEDVMEPTAESSIPTKKFQPPPKIMKMEPAQPHIPPNVDLGTRCRFCRSLFLTMAGLKRHYERSQDCQRSSNVLLVPVQTTGASKGPGWNQPVEHICPMCRDKFPGEISLREHRKICSVRECPICTKRFKGSTALSNHMQDEHAGRRKRRRDM